MVIQIKTLEQLKLMRKAGLVVAEALNLMKAAIAPGVTPLELDAIAADYLEANNLGDKRRMAGVSGGRSQ